VNSHPQEQEPFPVTQIVRGEIPSTRQNERLRESHVFLSLLSFIATTGHAVLGHLSPHPRDKDEPTGKTDTDGQPQAQKTALV